jgi:hypothetical protein
MDGQIGVVVLRCRECRRRRPAETPTALGRLVRVTGGRWQADRFEHSPVVLQPFWFRVSPLGDPGHVLTADDGRLWSLSLIPVPLGRDIRIDEYTCRGGCGRPPVRVTRAKTGARALAQGRAEVDV